MKTKIIAAFFAFILISTTFAYADLSDPVQAAETGVKDTAKALSTFEDTDLIINVDSYQPTVLSEQAFESDQPGGYPIFATLTGTKTNPLMELQKLSISSIRPTGGTTKYVSQIYYKQPTSGYFDVDNLGYIVIRLRNIKEDEVPKKLDINMTADITLEIQNGFGTNEKDLILPILDENEFLNRKSEFSFFGGRGYLRLESIKGDTAVLAVYDGQGNKEVFSVKEGKESYQRYISGGVSYLLYRDDEDIGRNYRNTYQVRVNQITGNKDKASIEMIFNGEYKLKEFVEGQYIYPGSKWKVKSIKISDGKDEVELFNEQTKERVILKGGSLYIPEEVTMEGKITESDDALITDVSLGSAEEEMKWVEEYSKEYGVDPNLVKGLIHAESSWRMVWTAEAQRIVDSKNFEDGDNFIEQDKAVQDAIKSGQIKSSAFGYGQIVRSTAEDLSKKLYDGMGNPDDRFDPEKNIQMTVYYLSELLRNNNNDERRALRAYTGSSGGEKHVDRILALAKKYKGFVLESSASADRTEEKRVGCCNLDNTLFKNCSSSFKYCERNELNWVEGGSCKIGGSLGTSSICEPPKSSESEEESESGASTKAKTAEEELIDKIPEDYQSFKKELKSLISPLKTDFDEIKPILDKYKKLLEDADKTNDEKLFKTYRNLVLKDMKELDDAYRASDIAKQIRSYIINNFNFQFHRKGVEGEQQSTEIQFGEGTPESYFQKAIESYRAVISNYDGITYEGKNLAMEAQLKIAEIYDYYLRQDKTAVEEYNNLITKFDYPEADVIQDRIKFIELVRMGYSTDTTLLFENGNSISMTLYGTTPAREKAEAKINVNGELGTYSLNSGENKLGNTGWYLKEINLDSAVIAKQDGEKEITEILTLGNKNPVKGIFILEDVIIHQEAYVTIMPGDERIKTQSNFMLHIPVEPRLWKLSPEQIEDHISATRKLIEGVNKAIDAVELAYKVWSISCYSTFAILWVKNLFWFGSKARNLARKTVMEGWKEECSSLVSKDYGGDIYECIIAKKKEIDADMDIAQKIYADNKDYNSRIKALARADFNLEELETSLDEEAFHVLLEEEIKINENMDVDGARTAVLEGYERIKEDKDKLKEEYGFSDESFAGVDRKIKGQATSEQSTSPDVEQISKSRIERGIVENGNHIYSSPTDIHPSYVISKQDNDFGYVDEKGKFHKINMVDDEAKSKPDPQTAISLIRSGKYEGHIDKLSLDSVYYLRVSERGGDEIPLSVEIWERHAKAGSDNLNLETRYAERVAGPFSLSDCIRGSTSDRKETDLMASLKLKFPGLQKSCSELRRLDGNAKLREQKHGSSFEGYAIQRALLETGGMQCFDMMDVGDCLTLFSVCDPVMCPVSRFTAGGWKVDNVVSTGIFGSIFLGSNLWRATPIPEVGICIPGIDAGLKNYRSLFEGYEQCLTIKKEKGENVGICDTIRSIGICKIAWREGTSLVRVGSGLDKLLGFFGFTDKAAGGGEYGFFQSNIKKTGDFLNFFTKEYATTYFSAYRGASTDEIGEELCKAAIYGKVPGKGDFLDQLIKPEGPVQFTGWFTEMPYSNLAGEVKSDYEVYYHIYAGEDREKVRYYVYLKDIDGLLRNLYATKGVGYLNRGDFVDETVRRQEATGYDELCIVIENKENCGFGKVSSGLLFDYLEDKNLDIDASTTIKTEQECIGESTVFTDPGLNMDTVGNIVDAMYPNIARNGLIRQCSKENPGKGANEDDWAPVGTCGNNTLGQGLGGCWLSRQSYKDALSEYDLNRRKEAERFFKDLAGAGLKSDEDVKVAIDNLISKRDGLISTEDYKDIIKKLNELSPKTLNVDLDAKIAYEIGETYYKLALHLRDEEIKEEPTVSAETPETVDASKLKYKVVLIRKLFGVDILSQDFVFIWDGSKWIQDYFTSNTYHGGLDRIKKFAEGEGIRGKIEKVELYCSNYEKDPYTLILPSEKDIIEWINEKAEECQNKKDEVKYCEIEYNKPWDINIFFRFDTEFNNGLGVWKWKKNGDKDYTIVPNNFDLINGLDKEKVVTDFDEGLKIIIKNVKDSNNLFAPILGNIKLSVHYNNREVKLDESSLTVHNVKIICNLQEEKIVKQEELISDVKFSGYTIDGSIKYLTSIFTLNENLFESAKVDSIKDGSLQLSDLLINPTLRVYDLDWNIVGSFVPLPSGLTYTFILYSKGSKSDVTWKSGEYIYEFTATDTNQRQISKKGKFVLFVYSSEPQPDKKFWYTAGGFDIFFDENSFEISEDTANLIISYVKTIVVNSQVDVLEIVSYVSGEGNDLSLSERRLDDVLNTLNDNSITDYLSEMEVKKESRGEISNYGLNFQRGKENFGRKVQVRFIDMDGDRMESLFEGYGALRLRTGFDN